MRVAFVVAVLVIAACDQAPMSPSSPQQQAQPVPLGGPARSAADVEGWDTSEQSYAKLGTTAPNFSASSPTGALPDGYTQVTQDTLRGRWTILAFPGEGELDGEEELRYLNALRRIAAHCPPRPRTASSR
jgi:hypothetical protein